MSDTSNTEKNNDLGTQATVLVAAMAVGCILIVVGVIGMLKMAGEAIYESYGALPLLTLSVACGIGVIVGANRMLRKL